MVLAKPYFLHHPQLLPQKSERTLPCAQVECAPEFIWNGLSKGSKLYFHELEGKHSCALQSQKENGPGREY